MALPGQADSGVVVAILALLRALVSPSSDWLVTVSTVLGALFAAFFGG